MIEVKHLRKEYGNVVPIKDMSFTINNGDVISIIGPSGTGKSTLLRCINQLEKPTSGEIYLNGKNILEKGTDLTEVRKHIGMVFQSFNLYPHLSIIENVMVPQIDLLNRSKQEAYDKAISLLKTVGLADKAYNYPDQLSGGQKQRVAIARTLAMDTEVILFDEPTSALDPTMVDEVQAVIKQLAESGKTMMIVTHEMRFAKSVANRVLFLNNGEVYEDGTPEQIFEHPQREFTRKFIFRIKEENIDLTPKTYSLPDCIAQLSSFISRNCISTKSASRMYSIFEEMVAINLIPHLQDDDNINVHFEYSEIDNSIKMDVKYTGKTINVEELMDSISKSIIQHYTISIKHEKLTGEDGFTNMIKLSLNTQE